jgi:WD40 repeat protein
MKRVFLAAAMLTLATFAGFSKEKPTPRVDLYGDPLPPGAVARLGTVRLRHDGTGHRLGQLMTPDAKTIITSGMDRRLRFWDATTGIEVGAVDIRDHVWSMALAPDGQTIAVAGLEGIGLWDIQNRTEFRRFPLKGVFSLTFTPDGKHLVTGGMESDRSIRVLEVATGKELRRMMWHTDRIMSLKVLPDNRTLYSTSMFGSHAHVADLQTGQEIRRIGLNARSTGILPLPDGKQAILFGSRSNQPDHRGNPFVELYELETEKLIRVFPGHELSVAALLTPDGNTLITWDSGLVRLWDVQTGKETGRFPGNAVPRQVSANGGTLFLVQPNGSAVELRDLPSGKIRHSHDGHQGSVHRIAFAPDGRSLVSTSWPDLDLRIWDLESQRTRCLVRAHQSRDHVTTAMAFLPDGSGFISGGSDEFLRLWNQRSGTESRRFPLPGFVKSTNGHRVVAIRVAPDGKSVVAGSRTLERPETMTYLSWDVATGRESWTRQESADRKASSPSPCLSPDGKRYACVTTGSELLLADVQSGQQLAAVRVGEVGHESIAFSPDGQLLAFTSYLLRQDAPNRLSIQYMRISVHEVPSLRELFSVPVQSGRFIFSPDSRTLAVAVGSRVEVHELASGKMRWTSPDTGTQCQSLDFTPDGKLLASGMENGSILVWDLTPLAPRQERNKP